MNKRIWKVGVLALLLASAATILGWGQGAPVYPQGLIIDPPGTDVLEVSIWTDKPEYQVGDLVTISYEVNKDAYIYIWDITPEGDVQVVFPNDAYPGGADNFVQAGTHQLPQSFPIAPPLGTEYLQILATTRPVDVAAFPMSDPALFQQEVEVQVLGLLLEDERTWGFTTFEITDEPAPSYGTLIVNSNPPGASIDLDGGFIGFTPKTHFVTQGLHRLSISKPGYATKNIVVVIFGTGTRTVNVDLTPLFPTNDPPNASFTVSPPNPTIGSFVQFNGASSFDSDGSIGSYEWSFGDGTSGFGPFVSHRFTIGGTFSVTLTVTDDDGAADSTTRQIQVGPTTQPPVASFTFNPESPQVGTWIQFNASASSDPDGSITSYEWSFGDGSAGFGPFVSHRFMANGTYSVTLTVTDNDALSSSTTQQVQIGQAQQAPVAAFTYSPLSPTVGQTITFDASSSFDPDGRIVSYGWDLNGDGVTDASGPIGQVRYGSPGSVPVRLTVTDNDGLSSFATQTIVVGQGSSGTGAPPIGTTPGIFVWGTDRWHITVNAGADWSAPRTYRLELETDGTFQNVNQPSGGGVFPLGLITTPPGGGKTLLFEGTLGSGAVDHTFTIPGATKLILSLEMDIDGDGDLDESPSFVYLRRFMVNPPSPVIPGDWDLTFGLPRQSTTAFLPTVDFRIGYTRGSLTIYMGSISDFEGP